MSLPAAIFCVAGWILVFGSAHVMWGPAAAIFAGGVGIVLGVLVGVLADPIAEISRAIERSNSIKTKGLQQ